MQYYGITDIGMQRKENQDMIFFPKKDDEIKLFIVADGMGGANAGDIASKMAIEYAKEVILTGYDEAKDDRGKIEDLINKAISGANNYVYNKSIENIQYAGMGTTLSLALIVKNKIYIGHVGDSRIYRIRKNIIRQLTKDHSYVQALVRDGTITKAEAENHPQKNMLLRVVGCEKNVEVDVMVKGFLKDDILLMCSDGLTNMLATDEIYYEVIENKGNLEFLCKKLVNIAKSNGGYDNISVILVRND